MVKLTDIKGIGPATIKILQERKIKTVEALASLSLEELRKIPGFKGELRARAVKQAAADSLREKPIKQAKPAGAADSSPLTVIKKTVAGQIVNPPEADKAKDKDKGKDEKKARKDDKKAVKDKEKKKKHKDKKKDGKKKDKKKS
ncbi:helix-hairpin-helix domain-containing protein [Nitrosomonas sp. Is24]|uniref:helix-hairpin-helix domain-containing protein n=1 Tax=Nitrosomonas sp. Is24 TaxID=3080533 RepID=UPI00294B03E2|nr:helix-hairpin-helix domain-containing protein [Nitrosomonas sp. Is24]MDV6342301.1 helix-hairpin-helix domain-containing protein [Nitrosomonas sp. Is24]